MLPENLHVADGALNITGEKRNYMGASYAGGQLTTWNRMCYQGGYLEVRYQPPGAYGVDGNWPAIWTMGKYAGHFADADLPTAKRSLRKSALRHPCQRSIKPMER